MYNIKYILVYYHRVMKLCRYQEREFNDKVLKRIHEIRTKIRYGEWNGLDNFLNVHSYNYGM